VRQKLPHNLQSTDSCILPLFSNFWLGLWEHRLPYVNFSLQSALLGLAFLGIVVGSVFVNKNYAKNVGDLAAVTAFICMLPATRNGILVVLLGLPLDRAILYHRWLGRCTLMLATARIFKEIRVRTYCTKMESCLLLTGDHGVHLKRI
jgi:hypothetical protein